MKHWIPPAAILTLILSFCLWDGIHMRHETARWCEQLQQAEALAAGGNWTDALQALDRSHQDWQAHQVYVHSVSPRDTVDDTEAMYHRASAFAKTEEITEFRAELADLRDQMRILADLESFSYRSIF